MESQARSGVGARGGRARAHVGGRRLGRLFPYPRSRPRSAAGARASPRTPTPDSLRSAEFAELPKP